MSPSRPPVRAGRADSERAKATVYCKPNVFVMKTAICCRLFVLVGQ